VYQRINPEAGGKPVPGSKTIIANILVSLADLSFFFERNAGKDVTIANLMDF